MRRRFRYALTAGVLSSGAPAGLLGLRLASTPPNGAALRKMRSEIEADRTAYLYVGGATAVIFALFGYILGRQADRLADLSETDSLTQLLNARGFASRLNGEARRAKRYREPMSVLFLDVDGLKQINDAHGHRAGSDALRQVADIIRRELRASDAAARWGGDEFTILAPNTDNVAALCLAERIRGRLDAEERAWKVTASIGVATLVNDTPATSKIDPRDVMRAADSALYDAKRRGKNTVAAAASVDSLKSPVASRQPEVADENS